MRRIFEGLLRRIRRVVELVYLVSQAWGVARASRPLTGRQPVIFFNASTRLSGLSQNAAFSLITSWAVRLSGSPVVHFVCKAGMNYCLLGTDEIDLTSPMPCGMCIRQSRANYAGADKRWFTLHRDGSLEKKLQDLNLNELLSYEQPLPSVWIPDSISPVSLPLGALVLPSLRWRLRLQSLPDDERTRLLCREFMLSAWNVASEFSNLLNTVKPQVVVLFNGMHFPEAVVFWLCRQKGVRLVTHESGFQPFSGYFVEGQATMYPISIPAGELTQEQNTRLDADLQKRWQGDFSMAGVRFWHEIHGLSDSIKNKIAVHKQTVAIFTNVIFDTSQLHANQTFRDMFDWLETLLDVIRVNPETLFIIRAHPDEARPGKVSRESVAMWVEQSGAADLMNVVFIPPQERLSSYDLVKASKFVMVYNSTISLESTLLSIPALCAARSPFTDYGTAFFEPERESYLQRLNAFLAAEDIHISQDSMARTRRFMYYRYYRFSLPFGDFIESSQQTGYVRLRKFTLQDLEISPTADVLLDGLFHGERFELEV